MRTNTFNNVPEKSGEERKAILKKLLPHLERNLKTKGGFNPDEKKTI